MNPNWTRNLIVGASDGKERMSRRAVRAGAEHNEDAHYTARDERSNAIQAARDFAAFGRRDLAERCIARNHIAVEEFIGNDHRGWTRARFASARDLYGQKPVDDWAAARNVKITWPAAKGGDK